MQKNSSLKAFFFLGLFSLMMLHQAYPHMHHEHIDSHSQNDLASINDHHHHDEGTNEKKDSNYSFFDFFENMHVHLGVSADIDIFNKSNHEKETVVYKDILKSSIVSEKLFLADFSWNDSHPIYHPPNTYFNSYFAHLILRGPPTLS